MYAPAFIGLLLAVFVSGELEITPRRVLAKVGQNVSFVCTVSPIYVLDVCRVKVGSQSYLLKPSQIGGEVVYKGEGLDKGQCGIEIKNVQENMNGEVTCSVPSKDSNVEISETARLVVASAPGKPVLESNQFGQYREGERLMASCTVPRGRPAANVSFFLDDEELLNGRSDPVIQVDEVLDLYTIRVNLTRELRAEDGGKQLVCRADHAALTSSLEAKMMLIVNYPPRRADGTDKQITIFGLKLGSEGRLNVTVRAYPPPSAQWTVNGQGLHEAGLSDAMTAVAPVAQGVGIYNVTLIIHRVEKQDVDRAYYLRVTNDFGNEDFVVRISTMDEPAGVELDAGAVVGIVIAALVLLVAVSLLVFAKATDRWCFAGARDPAKSSGESDTESAAGGRRRESHVNRARAAAVGAWGRVRAAIPKGRDKVQASEQVPDTEEDKPAEKKEGVVYAELALTETPREGERPAPPSTEYAEIVYTDQGQKEAKE